LESYFYMYFLLFCKHLNIVFEHNKRDIIAISNFSNIVYTVIIFLFM